MSHNILNMVLLQVRFHFVLKSPKNHVGSCAGFYFGGRQTAPGQRFRNWDMPDRKKLIMGPKTLF